MTNRVLMTLVEQVFGARKLGPEFLALAETTGLQFPELRYSLFKRIVISVLILAPLIAVGYFIFSSLLNFVVSVWVIWVIGFSSFVIGIFLPYGLMAGNFPSFFQPNQLEHDIRTYGDLVKDLVLTNRISFAKDDYALTRKEIQRIISEP